MAKTGTAVKKEKASVAFDASAVISKAIAATDVGKTTKSKAPVVDADAAIRKAADVFIEKKSKLDDLEAEVEAAKQALRSYAKLQQIKLSRERKSLQSTVLIPSNGPKRVQVTCSKKYTAIDPNNVGVIRQMTGERYGEFFIERVSVALSPEAQGDQEFMGEFWQLVAPFVERGYIKAVPIVTPTERYHEDRILDPAVEEIHKSLDGIVNPYQGTCTVKG